MKIKTYTCSCGLCCIKEEKDTMLDFKDLESMSEKLAVKEVLMGTVQCIRESNSESLEEMQDLVEKIMLRLGYMIGRLTRGASED